jgi:hypothetical protein
VVAVEKDASGEVGPSYASNARIDMSFTLTSSAFNEGDAIPAKFTCDGANLVPPLVWSEPPQGTRSFALIVDDPDAPGGTFTHWLVYDIPASAAGLADHSLGKTLRNDFGRTGYGGPCPPSSHGPHRYVFTLYALDVPLLTLQGRTRDTLERALEAHTLASARLMGRYRRKSRK